MHRAVSILVVFVLLILPETTLSGQTVPLWEGKQADDTDDVNTRESSQFSSGGWRSVLRVPELPRLRPPTLPGFSGLRDSTSSTFNQAKRSTRRFWTKTKDFILNPFDSETDSESDRYSQEKTSNGWFWWFSPQPEEPEVETVNEFLKLERPRM